MTPLSDSTLAIPVQPTLGKTRHIHLVGIGGIGMSGIAEILLHQGYEVSGSDGARSENTDRLEALGARIFIGHDASHVDEADVVVYTSAVKAEDNVETWTAMERHIPVIKRAEMLAEMMRMKVGIGVAGTHGKTTTTSMLGHIIQDAGLDPTIIVGGRVHSFKKSNAVVGKGDLLIIEADEYDRTFLKLTPSMAIITNVEAEHLDIYEDFDDVSAAFIEFAGKVPFYGAVIACIDDPGVQTILPSLTRRVITYGIREEADVTATNIRTDHFESRFEVVALGESLGEIVIHVPGHHNILNALGAIALSLDMGISFEAAQKGLARFEGVYRRFQKKMDAGDVLLIDDYAHHPTEVEATLQGAKKGWPERRIVAVFQPHLYSRTQQLSDEFGEAFSAADVVVITDVYPSREKPIEGVTGELIAEKARYFGHQDVHYVAHKKDLPDFLLQNAEAGDLIITMGAGDVYRFGESFASRWQADERGGQNG